MEIGNFKISKGLIFGIIMLIFGLITLSTWLSVNNTDAELRSRFKAQLGAIESNRDKMVKVIKDNAKIVNKQAMDFDKIYTDIISGRYANQGSNDGSLMKMISESNPQFSQTQYENLMDKIESLRTEFEMTQKTILDIVREHDNLRTYKFKSMFLSNTTPLKYEVISSSETKEVMKTHKDEFELEF